MKNPITPLRHIGYIEGISFLLLLGVAMPLKYLAGIRMAVTVAGWIHGILFVLFCVALLRAMVEARWPFARAALLFIAALLPFGPFLVDRKLRGWESDFLSAPEGA
jgi:integral membrane protein